MKSDVFVKYSGAKRTLIYVSLSFTSGEEATSDTI